VVKPNDVETQKDFLAVRGPRSLHITPQTSRGWRLGAYWLLPIVVPHIALMIWAMSVDDTPQETWVLIAVAPLLLLNGLTIWAMIVWMLRRADVVSPADVRAAASGRRTSRRRD
jgi:hypothetical protein